MQSKSAPIEKGPGGSHTPHPSWIPGIVRAELRKALGANPWFWLPLAAGCALAVGAAVYCHTIFQNTLEMALAYNKNYSSLSCFAFWMPVYNYGIFTGVFTLIWPLLTAAPYAWSWGVERRRGVLQQEALRTNRRACYRAKAVAAFLSGSLVVLVPYLLNLTICACYAPAASVWASDQGYVAIFKDSPLSSLFYLHPLAFSLVWSVIAGVVAGLWATTVLSLTLLIEHPAEAITGSYVVLYLLVFASAQVRMTIVGTVGAVDPRNQKLFDILRWRPLSLNLFQVISPSTGRGGTEALIIALVLLALASIIIPRMRMKKDLL